MHTHNETVVRAPLEPCLRAAAEVERWPEILPHYRDVHFTRRDGPYRGRVHMSAFRHFGLVPWPTWWESEMVVDREAAEIRYRHVAGITEGMDVLWTLEEIGRTGGSTDDEDEEAAPAEPGAPDSGPRTRIVILHDWDGPGWPLVGGFAARRVIGPHFIRVVADRTLAGVRREAEARHRARSSAIGDAGGGRGPDG